MKPRLFITGASSGIGRALALLAFGSGWDLVLCGRDEARLAEVSRLCGDAPVLAFDLTNFESLPLVAHRVSGPIVLVNNAGVFDYSPFATESPTAIQQMIAVNLTAPILLTQALLPKVLEGGHLVNILSIAAHTYFAGSGVYGATKAGLEHWSKCLVVEHPELRIHNLFPGPVDTPIWDGIELDIPNKQPPDEIAREVLDCLSVG